MRIRVGTKAWNGDHQFEKGETPPCLAGITVQWIELDGHRIHDVASVAFSVSDEFSTVDVTIAALGTIDVAYLDRDGDEVTIAEVPTESLAGRRFDWSSPPWWPNVWRRLRVAKARW